jgi:hypothetical protein
VFNTMTESVKARQVACGSTEQVVGVVAIILAREYQQMTCSTLRPLYKVQQQYVSGLPMCLPH